MQAHADLPASRRVRWLALSETWRWRDEAPNQPDVQASLFRALLEPRDLSDDELASLRRERAAESRRLLEQADLSADPSGLARLTPDGNALPTTIDQLPSLIDDLLAFSRVGRSAMQPSPVDMATLARSIFFEITTAEDRERIDFAVAPLPPAGSIVGATDVAVCEECPLQKQEKSITRFYRPYEITPQPGLCLLEQGIVCMGPATRGGCGALCPQVNMGCRGCYGPLDGVYDQGAKMLSAIASVIGVGNSRMEEAELEREIQAVVDTIPDPAGTFYRFSMAHSLLQRSKTNGK